MKWTWKEMTAIRDVLQMRMNSELQDVFRELKKPELIFRFGITDHAVDRAIERLNTKDGVDLMTRLISSTIRTSMTWLLYFRAMQLNGHPLHDIRLKYDNFTAPIAFRGAQLNVMTWYVSDEEIFGENVIDVKNGQIAQW